MELFLVALLFSISNIVCVLIGVRAGARATASDNFKIQNPVEKVKERRENKELSREQKERQEAVKTMLHNIDVYDGTDIGQQDVRY